MTCSQRDKTTLTLRAGSTGMNSLGHALRFEAIRPEQALGAARLFFGLSNTDVHVLWCLEVEYSQPAVAGGGDAARLPTQPNAYSFVVRSTAVINGFNGGLTTLAPSGADAKGEKNGADLRPGKIIAYAKRVVASRTRPPAGRATSWRRRGRSCRQASSSSPTRRRAQRAARRTSGSGGGREGGVGAKTTGNT